MPPIPLNYPQTLNTTTTSAVVAGWAKEFDLDAVAQDELVRPARVLPQL